MIKLHLGAKRYRCNACRCNFASFKPCRDKTMWRRRTPVERKPAEPGTFEDT
jgi:predicted HD phosphohydrolase